MKASIETLYKVCSKYPYNPAIEACPCCVKQEYKKLLLPKPLKALGNNELRRYAFKAMTTWGQHPTTNIKIEKL